MIIFALRCSSEISLSLSLTHTHTYTQTLPFSLFYFLLLLFSFPINAREVKIPFVHEGRRLVRVRGVRSTVLGEPVVVLGRHNVASALKSFRRA